MICAHGELTPNFTYIQQLRELNPQIQDVKSSVGMQGFTLQLSGHLFDKQIINKILDLSEESGINFRVVSWNVGQTLNQPTAVVMQGLGTNDTELDATEDRIMEFCKKEDVSCKRIKGPAYESNLP